MSTRRRVDVALVVLAAFLLGAGVAYWIAAAPAASPIRESPVAEPAEEALDLTQLEQRVADALTVSDRSVLTDTGRLEAGESRLYQLELEAGTSYTVEVVCAGQDAVSVELPSETVLVACEPDPSPQTYSFTGLFLHILNVVNQGHDPVAIGIGVRPT
jgi:hypothetical protein